MGTTWLWSLGWVFLSLIPVGSKNGVQKYNCWFPWSAILCYMVSISMSMWYCPSPSTPSFNVLHAAWSAVVLVYEILVNIHERKLIHKSINPRAIGAKVGSYSTTQQDHTRTYHLISLIKDGATSSFWNWNKIDTVYHENNFQKQRNRYSNSCVCWYRKLSHHCLYFEENSRFAMLCFLLLLFHDLSLFVLMIRT